MGVRVQGSGGGGSAQSRGGLGEPIAVLDGIRAEALEPEETDSAQSEIVDLREERVRLRGGGSRGSRPDRPFLGDAPRSSASLGLTADDLVGTFRPPVEDADGPGEVIEDTEITGALWKLDFFGHNIRFFDRRRNVFALDPQAHPIFARPTDPDEPGGAKEPTPVLIETIEAIRQAEIGARASGFLATVRPDDGFLRQIFSEPALLKGRMNKRFVRDKGQVIATFEHPIRGGEWAIFLRIISGRMWEFRIDKAPSDLIDDVKRVVANVVEVVGDVLKDLIEIAKDLGCSLARDYLEQLEATARERAALDEDVARDISDRTGIPLPEIDDATAQASGEGLRRIGNRLVDSVCGGNASGTSGSGGDEDSFFARNKAILIAGGIVVGGAVLLG